jgi:hypothetical protein
MNGTYLCRETIKTTRLQPKAPNKVQLDTFAYMWSLVQLHAQVIQKNVSLVKQ